MKFQLQVNTLSRWLMIVTILLIAGFQCYWITRLFNEEWRVLQRETDVLFRDIVYKLQVQRFKSDTSLYKTGLPDNLFMFDMISSTRKTMTDSMSLPDIGTDTNKKQVIISLNRQRFHTLVDDNNDTTFNFNSSLPPPGAQMVVKYFTNNKILNDSLPLSSIDSAYKTELVKNNIRLAYILECIPGKRPEAKAPQPDRYKLKTNFTFVGLSKPYAYRAEFANPFNYIIKKLASSILISLLLIAFTIVSFVFLYRNLLMQRRLALMKNEFISNITHELKTPIATVTVAIEALRNFNAIYNPEKTREYLDISAGELQRLSMLVDKVLRLSMFENKEVELKNEVFDVKVLTEEVIAIMRLQFENRHARVTLVTEGDTFTIEADRLHITSVLYNLLDNALKYSDGAVFIELLLMSHAMHVELKVKDNGIGIPAEYRLKVFEKFFRIPTGNVHNTKGCGLGLSYVNHIVKRHHGFVEVESEPGKGSTFTVNIPYKQNSPIFFDDKRSITRRKLL